MSNELNQESAGLVNRRDLLRQSLAIGAAGMSGLARAAEDNPIRALELRGHVTDADPVHELPSYLSLIHDAILELSR